MRKLLAVEINRSQINMIVVAEAITKLFHDQSIDCHVHELPTAEELGRLALNYVVKHSVTPMAFARSPEGLGQAILDALLKRRERE